MQRQLEASQRLGQVAEARDILSRMSQETSKRDRWAVSLFGLVIMMAKCLLWQFENSLRRHNHIGLAHALLLALAKAGRLQPVIENARQLMRERIERHRERGPADMDED